MTPKHTYHKTENQFLSHWQDAFILHFTQVDKNGVEYAQHLLKVHDYTLGLIGYFYQKFPQSNIATALPEYQQALSISAAYHDSLEDQKDKITTDDFINKLGEQIALVCDLLNKDNIKETQNKTALYFKRIIFSLIHHNNVFDNPTLQQYWQKISMKERLTVIVLALLVKCADSMHNATVSRYPQYYDDRLDNAKFNKQGKLPISSNSTLLSRIKRYEKNIKIILSFLFVMMKNSEFIEEFLQFNETALKDFLLNDKQVSDELKSIYQFAQFDLFKEIKKIQEHTHEEFLNQCDLRDKIQGQLDFIKQVI